MTVLASESLDALAPVRERLLADARQEADRVLRAAREQAAAQLDQARAEAVATVERGRQAGHDLAVESVAHELARARREARGVVLAAQEEIRQRVRQAVRDAAAEWSAGPEAGRLREALLARVRDALGPDAEVRPAVDGGFVGSAGSRRVDGSLTRLVDAVLDERAREVSRLWS
jgi:vacuolar-type H+-ATPase subunit E/Vma4